MAQILIRLSLLVIALLAAPLSWATHIRGAEIQYQHVSGNTYTIIVHFYLDPTSPADREEVVVDMGDGTNDTLPRLEIIPLPDATCETSLNVYVGQHTFSGPGTYTIAMRDPNRNGGILNILDSDEVEMCARAVLVIDPLIGGNSSPVFDAQQTEVGYEYSTLVHQPNATDLDGDSLSFDLITPHGDDCLEIPGYTFPPDATPGADFAWADPLDGSFHWHNPQLMGEFVIAIRCREWRNGTMVGEVVRDMTLCISALPSSVNENAYSGGDDAIVPMAQAGLYQFTGDPATLLRVTDMAGQVVIENGRGIIDLRGRPRGVYVVRGSSTTRIAWSRRLVHQ
ncbi:MAG: hypothetical protein KA175_01710 [Flavobacteriales bacterium]|nr:hypothetical protein [Flavobacteriales bacterium]MBP6696303.1 hypothetical protein [Flavobacteriales bacterium]